MKNILVTGAGGFIGHHLTKRLKAEGHRVIACDWKFPEYEPSPADIFLNVDLRFKEQAERPYEIGGQFDEVYQLAANMGGMGFIENYKAVIMRDSMLISINVIEAARKYKAKRLFYSSSACVYNHSYQKSTENAGLSEDMAYPAQAEPGYGWEKLYTEMMCTHFREDFGLETRMARYHNIYGPLGTWTGGREKAPAAMCRKVAMTPNGSDIEIWGDGEQTRSFTYIDDCVEGTIRLMRSDFREPLNIGSDYLISINDLAKLAMSFEGKKLNLKHIKGPLGVRGRNSNNDLIKKVLGWAPATPLEKGLKTTYFWIKEQIQQSATHGKDVKATSYLPDAQPS